jgi:translation initiation factor 2-alpha kinase 4
MRLAPFLLIVMVFAGNTTDVGTVYYVAPELTGSLQGAVDYPQKVDVYSLGVVVFEMFYRPLLPGMERMLVLNNLRRPPHGILPDDFDVCLESTGATSKQRMRVKELLTRMLVHDTHQRPNLEQLLNTDLVPALEVYETNFLATLKKTMNAPGTRLHKWTMEVGFIRDV